MPFDWESALKAGYSLDDISGYLFGPNRKKQAVSQNAPQSRLQPAGAPDPYTTKLSPQEERQFQAWKARYAPEDSGADYDLRGAFKSGFRPDPNTGHWPDTFKKPNHPKFSNESIYAGADAPRWEGFRLVNPLGQVLADETPEGQRPAPLPNFRPAGMAPINVVPQQPMTRDALAPRSMVDMTREMRPGMTLADLLNVSTR